MLANAGLIYRMPDLRDTGAGGFLARVAQKRHRASSEKSGAGDTRPFHGCGGLVAGELDYLWQIRGLDSKRTPLWKDVRGLRARPSGPQALPGAMPP